MDTEAGGHTPCAQVESLNIWTAAAIDTEAFKDVYCSGSKDIRSGTPRPALYVQEHPRSRNWLLFDNGYMIPPPNCTAHPPSETKS